MRIIVHPVPCLRDNYCYLVEDVPGKEGWLVDPSEAGPPQRALAERGLKLRGILATHHHVDHVGGIEALVTSCGSDVIVVAAHASDRGRVPNQTVFVDAPRERWIDSHVTIAGIGLQAMHIPGHTLGAIAWQIPPRDGGPADVFTGDTLFAAGCGRLFEGTPEMMFSSLRNLTALAEDTRLWFGHEYTAANLRFAASVEPDNLAVAERAATLRPPSTPTTVGLERATNPFVRAASVGQLAERRMAKDNW